MKAQLRKAGKKFLLKRASDDAAAVWESGEFQPGDSKRSVELDLSRKSLHQGTVACLRR